MLNNYQIKIIKSVLSKIRCKFSEIWEIWIFNV